MRTIVANIALVRLVLYLARDYHPVLYIPYYHPVLYIPYKLGGSDLSVLIYFHYSCVYISNQFFDRNQQRFIEMVVSLIKCVNVPQSYNYSTSVP